VYVKSVGHVIFSISHHHHAYNFLLINNIQCRICNCVNNPVDSLAIFSSLLYSSLLFSGFPYLSILLSIFSFPAYNVNVLLAYELLELSTKIFCSMRMYICGTRYPFCCYFHAVPGTTALWACPIFNIIESIQHCHAKSTNRSLVRAMSRGPQHAEYRALTITRTAYFSTK
jgi:hypothetical protein